ncbi:hypothetical protein LPW36_10115 [Jinshanibacter sp. LJY008]|uniref:Uncharacterized protein n=1 Tax=Limnobaculum eriocheiris TaxID=2897391 RepID=A0A9X1SL38_9GAMM|nr:hypothetical protein [Limnobaculum eriocheiris]MCD1126350.1 hypothetical protein [Limnobaculum eriocheiris]
MTVFTGVETVIGIDVSTMGNLTGAGIIMNIARTVGVSCNSLAVKRSGRSSSLIGTGCDMSTVGYTACPRIDAGSVVGSNGVSGIRISDSRTMRSNGSAGLWVIANVACNAGFNSGVIIGITGSITIAMGTRRLIVEAASYAGTVVSGPWI